MPSLLEIRDISKTFPGLRALDRVSMHVEPGEIVALLGQNGSGKSTLVKILAGIHDPDLGGEITVHGTPLGELRPAREHRLHFIHQDLGLIPTLTAVENLDISRPLARRGLRPLRTRREMRAAQGLLREFGADFRVDIPVQELTAAQRTTVAIVRALDGWKRADNVLVLDEPTATLHGEEVSSLFDAVRRVTRDGAGVIFVSHRLEEVLTLADRMVVLRDGRVVADHARTDTGHDDLARAIAGREVRGHRAHARQGGRVVLKARSIAGDTVASVNVDLCAGEIAGVTGLVGSGSEHLLGLLFGARPRLGGTVELAGTRLEPGRPWLSVARGIAFVPAERQRYGAVMSMTVQENLTLADLRTLRRRNGAIDTTAERREVAEWMEAVDLRPRAPALQLDLLSGGNQQKVVLAKCLRTRPSVLLMDEPTQGVDVGAKAGIHELVAHAAARGVAVLVASSDVKELTAICHRVVVLRSGRVVAECRGDSLSEARLVSESLGVGSESLYELEAAHP